MSRPPTTALEWTSDGAPRSASFGDVYFSREDGLAETRAVFLEGCGLPQAWAGRSRFTVAELGFGTGLNIAALLHLWRRTADPGARLHVFTVEGFPLTVDEAARALSAWPELAEESAALLAAWPSDARGFHRLDLPGFRVTIDVAILDVETALTNWGGQADAWFLDGFSPALNPGMWSEAVLALVGQRSAPGATAATFTVASAVRRGLQAAGFTVDKRPGHGRKRERLEARFPGEPSPPVHHHPSVAIVGAGIAGAALARAFRAQGAEPLLIDGNGIAASRNPAALITPGLDASGRAPARFYAETYARAVALYGREAVIISQGVTRLPRQAKDEARFAKVAAQDIFASGALTWRPDAGLTFHDGLVVEPSAVLAAWTSEITSAEVTAFTRESAGWRLETDEGPFTADIVILAAGWGTKALAGAPLEPIRGQASFVASPARPAAVVDGDYLLSTREGFLFGATHDRGRDDVELSDDDHRRNLAALARLSPDLAEGLTPSDLLGRAAIRAAAPDRLPLAGRLDEGLYILGGLGSRGFTTAPLLAEHICALALGLASPLPADLAALVDPTRFTR